MGRIRPQTYPLVIPQRATFEEDLQFTADGVPVNLTGYTLLAQVWNSESRSTKIIDLTVTYVNRLQGLFQLSLTRSQTRGLTGGGVWDLLVIEPSTKADYWLEGTVSVDIGLTDDQ